MSIQVCILQPKLPIYYDEVMTIKNKSSQKTTTLAGRQPSLNSMQGLSFSKVGQSSRSQGQKLWYHVKGLVTRNTHVQYENPICHKEYTCAI